MNENMEQPVLLEPPDHHHSVSHTLEIDLEGSKKVQKKSLINKINLLHFEEEDIYGVFSYNGGSRRRILPLHPLPCINDTLECIFDIGDGKKPEITGYNPELVFFEDGPSLILIQVLDYQLTNRGLSLQIPEEAYKQGFRKTVRNRALHIKAELIQHGISFSGRLVNFSAESFRVDIQMNGNSFAWLNRNDPVQLVFSGDHHLLYSAPCHITRVASRPFGYSVILLPATSGIYRFPPRKYRSTRLRPEYPIDCVFTHPLSGRRVERKIHDISGTGFSLCDDEVNRQLLPGLILPEVKLRFPDRQGVVCQGQVIYRSEGTAGKKLLCGVAILVISPEDHLRLLSSLHQMKDGHSYLNKSVDMKELWRFFFESGFIYPKKYAYLQKHKEEIKETYNKIYYGATDNSNPGFARHFIYQSGSRILGHLAMVRFFPKSWLIQHHASDREQGRNAGVSVLNQVGSFVNDTCRFESMNMDYLMCFYRQENKFPHRVFGGVARGIDDPKQCSLDDCAYLHVGKMNKESEPSLWTVEEPSLDDIHYLHDYYETVSGGLMLRALNCIPDRIDDRELLDEYRRLGVNRSIKLHALKYNGTLQTIVVENRTDLGVNFSELTNALFVFTFPHTRIPPGGLSELLAGIGEDFPFEQIPVLLFPAHDADDHSIVYEKIYTVWVLNTYHRDKYFTYLHSIFRTIQH